MIIEKVQPMSMRKGQYLYALEKFQTGFVYLYLGMLQQRGMWSNSVSCRGTVEMVLQPLCLSNLHYISESCVLLCEQ